MSDVRFKGWYLVMEGSDLPGKWFLKCILPSDRLIIWPLDIEALPELDASVSRALGAILAGLDAEPPKEGDEG